MKSPSTPTNPPQMGTQRVEGRHQSHHQPLIDPEICLPIRKVVPMLASRIDGGRCDTSRHFRKKQIMKDRMSSDSQVILIAIQLLLPPNPPLTLTTVLSWNPLQTCIEKNCCLTLTSSSNHCAVISNKMVGEAR